MNNIKEFRLAYLLTPRQLADLLGVRVDLLKRLENSNTPLAPEWCEAVALALNVPMSAISDPDANIGAIITSSSGLPQSKYPICRIGARFAILAIVAKLGGLNVALDLNEESLVLAIQNLLAYAEDEKHAKPEPEQRLNRLSQSLQIVALTILQSRGVETYHAFHQTIEIAHEGALSLLQAYSLFDQTFVAPENG